MTSRDGCRRAYQTNVPSQGAVYAYDAQDRLASRTVTSGATTTTTLYIHDLDNHVIAETDAAGVTLREYIWLNDIPIAVIDGADTATPTMYSVHTDHLGRPARMVAQNWASVWDVIYSPFGGVAAIFDSTTKLDMRFPGQWFQMESGLAYNWHRHYDASLGRYVQPDPMGLSSLQTDGPNPFDYVGGNPLARIDPKGQFAIPAIPVLIPIVAGAAAYYSGKLIITAWESRARGKVDPVQDVQPINPGKDCNGKCNPCPPNIYWEAEGDAHGSTGGKHRHGIEWHQAPDCTCYPKRVSHQD
ncbi:RHS repeat domain-containing protein [Methylocystis parvus]|nr:RHS repeat-associated core domain-containing protein [Methylocystis parvus]WBK01281.1 RHS repeat-associated core domain-containing protein [Methylocystis parvus OBBP]